MKVKNKRIYIATTMDTKGPEVRFVKNIIENNGLSTLVVDLSTQYSTDNRGADINARTVADFHPNGSGAVFCGDRGKAVSAMATAFDFFIRSCDDISGLIGFGGSGGTALITPAMQSLPIGLPKLMVSTMASGDISGYIGASDIAMMYSVTDIAGINRISRLVLENAANSITGQVYFSSDKDQEKNKEDKPSIGLSMFGVTTPCIHSVISQLEESFDCLVFHATGSGGRAMEKLVDSDLLSGILDLTTTEVCDFLFDGVLACPEDRFGAVIRKEIPYVGSCGALDMINFGHIDTIPEQHRERLLYQHNSQVTLMRTTSEECEKLGYWIGEKLNKCNGEIRFLIPEGGFSALDMPGRNFWNPEANEAFIYAIEKTVIQTEKRQLIKYPYHINDPLFAKAAVKEFLAIYK
jgi:uncharacterized protein (UPF0261 family)